jgi:hypothetical protein
MAATATLMDKYEVFLSFLVFQEKQNSLKEKRVSAAPAFRLPLPLPSDGHTPLTHYTRQAFPSVEVWKCETEFRRITLGRAGQETYADNTDPIGLNKSIGEWLLRASWFSL